MGTFNVHLAVCYHDGRWVEEIHPIEFHLQMLGWTALQQEAENVAVERFDELLSDRDVKYVLVADIQDVGYAEDDDVAGQN